MYRTPVVIGAMLLVSSTATIGQESGKASARDMYFAGLEERYSDPASSPSKQKARPAVTPPAAKSTSRPPVRTAGTTRVTPAKAQTSLGMRYTILKLVGQQNVEVLPTTRFRNGDRIRLKVEVNDDGFLYVVHQGTGGSWSVMFPHEASEQGSNRVYAGNTYLVPHNSAMRFSGKPGVEKLFVVVSREPETAFDELIYTLQEKTNDPARPKQEKTLLAGNRVVEDPLVGKLRAAHSRDLVLESISEETSERTDRAVYVVNKTRKADARVVADIQLQHY